MIFTHSKNIFDTVSIAKKLPRGRATRDVERQKTKGPEGGMLSEKDAGMEPITIHESNR